MGFCLRFSALSLHFFQSTFLSFPFPSQHGIHGWVLKIFQQQYGINYNQTHALVVKLMAFRALFAYHDLDIYQLDVETAFLYDIIKQLIYVKLPSGHEKLGIKCKLAKCLYGLKQSARLWYETQFQSIDLKKLA